MTDARIDVPVDDAVAPTDGGPENVGVTGDSDRPAADAQAEPTAASVGPDAATLAEPPGDDRIGSNPQESSLMEPGSLPASPATVDPAADGQANSPQENPDQGNPDRSAPDRANPNAITADSTAAEPVAAAPPLRDPDEAALRLAEAAVFASASPVTPRALSQILPDDLDVAAVITALRARYEGRGLELVEIGGGLQFRTAADLAPQLRKVIQVPRRLPRVALETLAIVAYHQPITRPEIEDLRGTGLSQQTLDVLLETDLIVARGRKETPGRPTLWGTTAKFLEYFGLRDIRELPRRQDLLLEAVRPEAAAEAEAVVPDPQP